MELADGFGGEEVDSGHVLGVGGEVEGLFFSVDFDDAHPLIHFFLSSSVVGGPLDAVVLLLGYLFNFPVLGKQELLSEGVEGWLFRGRGASFKRP